jgi:putative transposase
VWSTDITYIRLARGFAYLVAIIDWYSRRVLAWRVSNSMDANCCIDCLEDALACHGKPEIFNSDQGSQFTSTRFTETLKREDVYLKGYGTMTELMLGLTEYFAFYNDERPHQSLSSRTPNDVHASGNGGRASIPDRFGSARENTPPAARVNGVSRGVTSGCCKRLHGDDF